MFWGRGGDGEGEREWITNCSKSYTEPPSGFHLQGSKKLKIPNITGTTWVPSTDLQKAEVSDHYCYDQSYNSEMEKYSWFLRNQVTILQKTIHLKKMKLTRIIKKYEIVRLKSRVKIHLKGEIKIHKTTRTIYIYIFK